LLICSVCLTRVDPGHPQDPPGGFPARMATLELLAEELF
jgi:hypothetical protein